MKKRHILTVVGLLFTLISSTHAHQKDPLSIVHGPWSSYYAVWARTGEPIVAYQEKLPLTPASIVKLIPSYCALKELGPKHQFETKFYSESPIQNGVIQNLLVKGEGDPSLVSEVLLEIVQQLKALGVQKIEGDIFVDASYFDSEDYPGRQENNERAYNAPTSAIALNFNTVAAEIASERNRLSISILPNAPSYLKLENKIRLGGRRAQVAIYDRVANASEIITLAGRFPPNAGPVTLYRSIHRPPEFFGHALADLLKESGVELQSNIKTKTVAAPYLHLLLNSRSKPLSTIIGDMNKFSNNFMAEQITKYLGAKKLGAPGTTEKGIAVLKNCLTHVGIDTSNLYLENGSGLSYQNKVTAEQLVKVLTASYRDPAIREALIASLSVNGVDGTMKTRGSPKDLEGVLRAKTGSLNGISSLAGFVPGANGREIAFVIMMNNLRGGLNPHRVQDELVLEWTKLKRIGK